MWKYPTTEGLEAIVTVFKIWHEGFEALRSRKLFIFISYKSLISLFLEIIHVKTGDHDDALISLHYVIFTCITSHFYRLYPIRILSRAGVIDHRALH